MACLPFSLYLIDCKQLKECVTKIILSLTGLNSLKLRNMYKE